jgi:hypothetical protein
MNLVLTERTCKLCKAKLTEFESTHNEELCIDCFKEKEEENAKE